MRDKGAWSEAVYTLRAKEARTRGSVTAEGEQRAQQGKGLDPLVDPSKYGVVRGANNLLVPEGEGFVLKFGVAMPVQTDIDTTGSMGGNVEITFRVQPKVQNLLIQGAGAVLRRYHTQIATGVIQDWSDQFPYERSQFEPDNEVERQMGLLVPEKMGGDAPEEYQIGLFAAVYLTKASIVEYGLRGYYFSVGDERGRDEIDKRLLTKVFGPTVLEVASLGNTQRMPSTIEVGRKLLENWHGFFLQVGQNRYVTGWWSEVLGKNRVIQLPRTDLLAEVQACIVGLTEGVFDIEGAADFLQEAGVARGYIGRIVDACGQIPMGLQTTFPNFDKIPMAGARFASRDDIWPIGPKAAPSSTKPVKATKKKKTTEEKGKEENVEKEEWQL